ncbi:MAG: BrnT family toxin [Rhodocyclaceae bacterium]|nr:BrnT family toxin [Rhodocyclaceae bacterium]
MHERFSGLEFDPAKNLANRRKHGVDLVDVEPVFFDPLALTKEDRDHGEARFLTLGMDGYGRLPVVCYTWRGDAIRVISARKADPAERKVYEGVTP